MADDCTNFPDCRLDCERCLETGADPASNPEALAEVAVSEALRDMRQASGAPEPEDACDDAYAFIASLRRQGFTVSRIGPAT